MAEFKNSGENMKDFKGVWVFCEQRQGELQSTVLELVSEGRKLADDLGVELAGLLVGDQVEGLAKEIGAYGADKVILVDDPALKDYTTDAYADVICKAVMEKKPEIVLIGATNIGRDLGPRCAARLHTGLTADCTHLDVDTAKYADFLREASTLNVDQMVETGRIKMDDRNLKMTRPAFGGHLMATIICPRFRPQMSTVRPGVLKKGEYSEAKANAVVVEKLAVELDPIKTQVVEIVKEAKQLVDLIGADVVVSVGRGISKDVEKGIKLAEELAEVLGGVVGGSRVAIDSGWLTADHQVGQTGKTVHPKLYIALGISGAIQHKAGMQDSENIIAVNKSESAPIFDVADWGICGDLFKVVPMMIETIKAAQAVVGSNDVAGGSALLGQLFYCDSSGDVVSARSAVLLRYAHAHYAVTEQLGDVVSRILLGAISLSCDRLDFFFGKLCESLPNQFLLFGQVEVHVLFLQFHYNMCFNNTQRN